MALYLASLEFGDEFVQMCQLIQEYDPEPPFDAGSLSKASDAVITKAKEYFQNEVKRIVG